MAQQTYSLVVAYNVAGQFAQNVFHWQFDDAGFSSTFAAAEALANAWATANLSPLGLMLPVDTAILSVKTRRVSSPGGFEALNLFAAGTHGARTGNLMVAACGICLVFYQSLNGKLRGRCFLPGVTDSDVSQGQIGAGLAAVIAAQAGSLISNLVLVGGGAPTANFVIYSRASKTGHLCGGVQASMLIATQRRRQVPF